ncbi:hypothetical protein [Nostoc sp. TCL240-02]|uniref:hypothetical protein n=1 Tax=Nostoc sp. TCL240-02 TaxID=2572090 RepID=UPI00157F91C2|nr:hypothetical protein [Nostoc sp. TCL240-02]QKQ73487.1 hypothetical protein FBB35_09185 [Nostoc sp. TCL240-02]
MCSTKLILLAVLIVVCVTYHLVLKIYLGKPGKLSLVQFVNVTTSAFSIISGGSTIHTLITSQQVRSLLGDDIVITLFVGVAAVIWVSIQQMLKP